MNRKRIDIYLAEMGFVETRQKAKALIMAGKVLVNEVPVQKPSQEIRDGDTVRLKETLKYVSRGALKLEKAFRVFKIDAARKSFIDFGASTGGFTDFLLQNGAEHVSCVDVGYGQLAWKIRNDSRVDVFERTNARYLKPEDIGGKKDAAVCDVSFISLEKILPAMDDCTKDDAFIVVLIKPQFQAGKEKVGKKGIVRDPEVHREVVKEVVRFMNEKTAFSPIGLDFSPIKGQKGNIEYLLFAKKKIEAKIFEEEISEVVKKAFSELNDF